METIYQARKFLSAENGRDTTPKLEEIMHLSRNRYICIVLVLYTFWAIRTSFLFCLYFTSISWCVKSPLNKIKIFFKIESENWMYLMNCSLMSQLFFTWKFIVFYWNYCWRFLCNMLENIYKWQILFLNYAVRSDILWLKGNRSYPFLIH